jgi:hypothetical protein
MGAAREERRDRHRQASVRVRGPSEALCRWHACLHRWQRHCLGGGQRHHGALCLTTPSVCSAWRCRHARRWWASLARPEVVGSLGPRARTAGPGPRARTSALGPRAAPGPRERRTVAPGPRERTAAPGPRACTAGPGP